MSQTQKIRTSSRRMRLWHWYFLVALLLGGAYGFASSLGFSWTALNAPVLLLLSFAMVASAMTCTAVWMRDIDELARQAHYVAWFWGGSLALCALIFVVVAAPALPGLIDFAAVERSLAPFAGEGGGFVAGVLASIFTLTVGYGAWWALYWLRKR